MVLRLVLFSSLVALACGGEEVTETGAIVTIAPDDAARVARMAVRVWDSEQELVVDDFLGVGATELVEDVVGLPYELRLRPSGGAPGRWFRVEVDLLDASHCPFGRASASAAYEPGRLLEITPEIAPLPTSPCTPVFVDPNHPAARDDATACTDPTTPCADLRTAVMTYAGDAAASVFYVAGGEPYTRADARHILTLYDSVGPLVLRPWPGTGMPIVDALSTSDMGIDVCCGETAARYAVIDGFEVRGAIIWGIAFNGANASDGVVRNSWLHDNGQPVPTSTGKVDHFVDAGVILLNSSSRITIEHNVIEGNGLPGENGVGVYAQPDGNGHVVRNNRIVDNTGLAVYSDDDPLFPGPIEIRNNVLCRNGRDAMNLARDAIVEHNSIVGNAGAALFVRGGAMTFRRNLVVGNAGGVLGMSGVETDVTDNYVHANGSDARNDGDPRLTDAAGCLLTLLPDSPARGGASDGLNPGAL